MLARFALLLSLAAAAACQRPPRTESASAAAATTTASATPPARPPAPDAALRETRWVLRQLGPRPVVLAAGEREAYLHLLAAGGVEGQGGCNRFRGPATTGAPGQLSFGPLLSTRLACPSLATEQEFMQALAATQAYRLRGDTLRLYATPAASAPALAKLVAVYLR